MDERPTVLVVEDEAILALNMEFALEDAGFEVVLAPTGDAAINKLEGDPQRFNAIVTDIRMPGRASGWDVAHRARELLPKVPVLYISGDSSANWLAKGVPGSKMLSKPFPIDAALVFLEENMRAA